jgi:hypothetical protein
MWSKQMGKIVPSNPPDDLPVYRLLTGKDDAVFCRRVSEAIELGYALYGSPSVTFNGEYIVAAQALIWPGCGASGPANTAARAE